MPIDIVTIVSEPFAENSYLVCRSGSKSAFVIDPGFDPRRILEVAKEREWEIVAILNTHGHVDHIAGNTAIREAFPTAPILIGTGDAELLGDSNKNLSTPFGMPVVSPPADRLLNDGDEITIADIRLRVLEIPGHSPGHIVYLVQDETPSMVLGGDVLFRGSIGRTDFPGGSLTTLRNGIRTKLWPLAAATIVYPGHGPTTTIGHERSTNPYLQ